MTPADPPIGDSDLQAYVDDALPADRRRVVAAYLDQRPEVAARVRAYREQRDALAERCRPMLDRPIPPRLRLANVAASRRRRQMAWLGRAAAAAVLLLAGGAVGWISNQAWTTYGSGQASSLAADAVVSHRLYVVERRHPVEVDASQEAHLVAWLSKRLGHPVRAPDLSALGFRLMGGRLLPAATGPAAQFMFENQAGLRLSLYVRTDLETPVTAFRYVEDQGVSGFYWIDRPLGYVLTGAIERRSLLEVAKVVYDQLD